MDAASYKRLMKYHAGAPVVIATGRPGQRYGLTATSFCSLSDEPPTVLVCVKKNASAHSIIQSTGSFSVNLLSGEHASLAESFAGITGLQGEQRFAASHWIIQETGAPILADALASLDCEVVGQHDHSTHSIFVGLVQALRHGEPSEPLLYFRGRFSSLPTA